jgi:hypothetical protein
MHIQADPICIKVLQGQEEEGISEGKMSSIKSRKAFKDATTPTEKWNVIWQILFPYNKTIPSPCKSSWNGLLGYND